MNSIRSLIASIKNSSNAARFNKWVNINTGIICNTKDKITKFNDPTFQNIGSGTNLYIVFDSSYSILGNLNLKPFFSVRFDGFVKDNTGLDLVKFWIPMMNDYYYTRPKNLSSIYFMM